VESKLGPLGTSATYWPSVPATGDCEDGEFGGMNGRGNRSTRRKPAPTPPCSPQIPLDQTRDWTRVAAVGSQRLTASAMARPQIFYTFHHSAIAPYSTITILLKCAIALSKQHIIMYDLSFHSGGYEECRLLTLVPRSRIFLPWRWRRYVPPKRRFTQDLHGATSQKTAFFLIHY
jgi:hypothetical protein